MACPSCLIASISAASPTGALLPSATAIAPPEPTLTHHTRPEHKNNAAATWLKTLFFILSLPRMSFLVFVTAASIRAAVNTVHDLPGHGSRALGVMRGQRAAGGSSFTQRADSRL